MSIFHFKQFSILQDKTAMKVGTDGVLLGSWASLSNPEPRILDIGTGTGLIALMMAQKCANCIIDAIEIDENAFLQAKENVNNTQWANRINVIHDDLNKWMITTEIQYDVIICNPPYFINGWRVDDAARKKARDAESLPYSAILKTANKLLKDNGQLLLILPVQEAKYFTEMAVQVSLFCIKATHVFTKMGLPAKRILMAIAKNAAAQEVSELYIADAANNYTLAYKELTRDFYLNF